MVCSLMYGRLVVVNGISQDPHIHYGRVWLAVYGICVPTCTVTVSFL